MSDKSIFTKIIDGDIPSHRIYEDDLTFAFLDIMPASKGHVLVVPKREVEFIWDLPDQDYAAVMATVKKVGVRLQEVLAPKYVGQLVIGTDVPHAHVHVVPFTEARELKDAIGAERVKADDAELAALAETLRF